jgi:HTH-type transcriptional regulator/antitoxin HigA
MTTKRARDQRDLYMDLIRQFPLRPIRSDAELEEGTGVLDSLTNRLDDLRAEERDYLAILTDIIERYEADTIPMPAVADKELLRHLIDAKNVAQAEVASATGIAESTISEVLAGRRKLNRGHIGKLARFFNVEPSVFVFDD